MSIRLLSVPFVIAAALATSACDLFTSAETRVGRAETHLEKGEYRAAAIELKNVLKKDAEHPQARLLLAQTEYQMGDVAGAETDLKRAADVGASASEISPWLARVYLATGRQDQVLEDLDTGKMSLAEPLRSIIMGRSHLLSGDGDSARTAFQAALAVDSASLEARVGLAEVQALAGDREGAIRSLGAVTAAEPAAAAAWLASGRLLLPAGRAVEAEAVFTKALEVAGGQLTDPEQIEALAGQFESRLAQGNLDGAAAAQAMVARRAANSPLSRLLAARLAIAQPNLEEAGRILQGLKADMPEEPIVPFLLGAVMLAQGNLNQADANLASVVRANPENIEARKLLAETRLRMNRPEAAIEVLTPALQGQVFDPRAEALLGAAQLEAGRDPTAVARLEQSVAQRPNDVAARLDLASLYLASGRASEAASLLRESPPAGADLRREALLINAVAVSKGTAAAKAEVDRLLRERPRDIESLNLAAAYFISARDLDAAETALERALAVEPGHVPSLVNLARVHISRGDLDGAEAPLRRALARDPGNVAARLALAEVASRRGRPDDAKKWLEEVRTADSQAIGSRLMLARLYLADKDSTKADAILKEIIAAAEDRPGVLAAVGELEMDFGRTAQALGRFRKAADVEPGEPEHWLAMARAQVALGYEQAALESLDRAIALDPDSERAIGHAVLFELKTGRQPQALERALALRQRLPASAAAASLEGDVRTALGQHDKAAEAYRQAAALQPKLYSVVREAQARQRAGAKNSAAPLAGWLRQHPDDIDARAIYAVLLDTSGQVDQAINEYERVLASGRASAVTANNLAWRYFERGDPRAEGLARQALTLAPDNAAVADTLGLILLRKGALDESLKLLGQAAASAPDMPELQLHYAQGLAAAGRTKEAKGVLDRLLTGGQGFEGRPEAEALRARLEG